VTGETPAVARVCDLPSVVPASRGKVEFEAAEEGRELEVLAHLLRKATADTFRARLAGVDLSGLQQRFDDGATVETGDLVPASELLERLGTVPGLAQILGKLGIVEESPGLAAAALEFAMEGLHLNRRLAKDAVPGRAVYGAA
jgi:magnesium chelatase subunit I